jgi:predicted RNase H-like HicB family nuclease
LTVPASTVADLHRAARGEINADEVIRNIRRGLENASDGPHGWYTSTVKLTIELDHEVDGRWVAEVPELNILLYGESQEDVIQRAQSAAREIVLDRIAHGELPPDSANAIFDVAA